jgi:hypothetical protein
VALVLVLVLSGVLLAVMTAVMYMITTGTQVSGLRKQYKTALEAGQGGTDLFFQIVATRDSAADKTALVTALNNAGLNAVISNTTASCSGTAGGATYQGIAAKLMTPSTSWSGCDNSIGIDTSNASSYDMRADMGNYRVYAKIVAATDGTTGAGTELHGSGVVSPTAISVKKEPYLYAIEVVSENAANPRERARLSVLYQY